MSAVEPTPTEVPPEDGAQPEEEQGHGGHGRWMMVACCVPMLLIAVLIALSGAGFGFLVIAVMCTLMMVAMMGAMSGPDGGTGADR